MSGGIAKPADDLAADGLAIAERARAKVNLTLEVLGRRRDGYHELASLVVFADLGDELRLTPAPAWRLTVAGPMARAIVGPNLIDKASDSVRAAWSAAATGHLHLLKSLPVAAGIGGGSADAAAALRALRRLNAGRAGAPDWLALARGLGADVPVCFAGKLTMMRGLGERLDAIELAVRIPAVLVNPATPLLTARVFADLAAPPLRDVQTQLPDFKSEEDLLAWVIAGRNDLEPPALRLAPIIGRVRAALQSARGCRLARLSGSGPTCFGLFASSESARAAAETIARVEPDWWVRATVLG